MDVFASTTAALQALDFTESNAEIETIEASIVDMQSAMARAESRCTEIARAMLEGRNINGPDVANALLADVVASEAAKAAPSRESMEEERTALRSGINDLRRRIEDARIAIDDVRRTTSQAMAKAVQPAIDALIAEGKSAAEQLLLVYSGLYAVLAASGAGRRELDRLELATAQISGRDNLLAHQTSIAIPDEIVDMLKPLANKGTASNCRIVREAPLPADRGQHLMIAAAAMSSQGRVAKF